MSEGTERDLRRDAERNRQRIVDAARAVFGREGLRASMASVAREAKVGIATVFRRFPTKDDLVGEVFVDRMTACNAAVLEALDDPDPWQGLVGFIETVCAMQAAAYGFADVLTMTFPRAEGLEELRDQAYAGVVQLIDRAKRAGRLRTDFTPEDLVLLYMANAGVVNATGATAPESWRRVVALLLQSYEAPARRSLPDPPSPEAMSAAMLSVNPTVTREMT